MANTRLKKIWVLFKKQSNLPLVLWRIIRKLKEKNIPRTLDNVKLREEPAARCTKKIERKVLKKQARKARAEHLVKWCLAQGNRKVRGKPLPELYVNGNFTEDKEEWQRELQRHCEEVYTDQEETREVQENRVEYFKKKGNQQFIVDGRKAEITVDFVLQARAKMSDNKVNGPEDTAVSEMIKQLPLERVYINKKCFQERFMGQMEAPSS